MIIGERTFDCASGFKEVNYGDDVDQMWGYCSFELDDEDITALENGKILYTDNGEYAIIIRKKRLK